MVESQKLMKSKLKLKLVSSDFPLFPEKPILSCDDKKSFQFKLQKENYLKNHPYRNLIFSPVVSEKEFIQHLIFTQKGLKYAKNCLKQPSEEIIRQKTFKFYEPKCIVIKNILHTHTIFFVFCFLAKFIYCI